LASPFRSTSREQTTPRPLQVQRSGICTCTRQQSLHPSRVRTTVRCLPREPSPIHRCSPGGRPSAQTPRSLVHGERTLTFAALVIDFIGYHCAVKYERAPKRTMAIFEPSFSITSSMSSSLIQNSPSLGAIVMMASLGSKPWFWTCEAKANWHKRVSARLQHPNSLFYGDR